MAYAMASWRRRNCWRFAPLPLALLLVDCCFNVHAATICVQAGDNVGLQNALDTAATNGEDDLIELQAGLFPMSGNFLLHYNPANVSTDLTIEGGYGADAGGPCALHPSSPNASATVLDGGLLYLHMGQFGSTGSLTLRGLTITNTFSSSLTIPPVLIGGGAGPTDSVTIENVWFSGNVSTGNTAIELTTGLGPLSIHDSLFTSNGSFARDPIEVIGTQQTSQRCVEVINSTFTDNAGDPMVISADCPTIIANDIFWGNGGTSDIAFAYPQDAVIGNSDFGHLSDTTGTSASNLLSVDPMFRNGELYYTLSDFSPLREAGDPGGFLFALGDYDVIGNPRINGARPDIGAYETWDVIFAHNFDFQPPF